MYFESINSKIIVMKTIVLSSFLLIYSITFSQNNLVVFTQESKPFYVIVNGIRQNMDPQTNVKIEGLPGEFYKVKAVFADGKTADVDKSVSFMEKNQEYSLEIKEKRGTYKMRFAGMRPINQSTSTGTSVTYHEEEITSNPSEGIDQNNVNTSSSVNSSTTQTNTSVQTNVSTTGNSQTSGVSSNVEVNESENGENVGVNVQMNEQGISMQVNVPEDQMGTVSQSNTTHTSQTTTSYSFVQTGTMCSSPNVNQTEFIDFKYVIENANMFKREELIIAYFKTHCMLSNQVAGLIQLDYSTVDNKKIAKEGYRYTYDTQNYNVVIDALENETYKKEVLTFIGAGIHTSTSTQTQTNGNGDSINNTIKVNTINSSSVDDVSQTQNSSSNTQNNVNTSTLGTGFSKLNGYTGYVNCNGLLIQNIADIKTMAKAEAFSEEQRKVIEDACRNNCLSVEQIGDLVSIFSHESDQLSFMKWAFDKTYDIDNFYTLSSQLTFSSSKDELDAFIDKQPTAHFTYVYDPNSNDGMLIDAKDLKKRMENEAFSDDQLSLAKQALVSRYISTDQVISILSVFSHESDKLQFLKMAYPRTSDKESFASIRELLTFSSSKEEFDNIMK